jgi:tocopherol O-methyltransferase
MIVPRAEQTSSDVARHYDELDQVYRQIWGEHVHHGYWENGRASTLQAVEALADFVSTRLNLREGDHVCDIGCGYGATAARFAELHRVRVTGFTLSEAQEKVASRRAGPLTFHRRDWMANGVPEATFDHAFAIESTEHIADKQGFFHEAQRTIRPGGRLIVCAWLASSNPSRFEIVHLLEPICREGRLPGMGTREEYVSMGQSAGFRLARFDDISRKVRRTWSICMRRLLFRVATDRGYQKLLASRSTRNRSFALTIPRLILAYRSRAMRYGVFTFERT